MRSIGVRSRTLTSSVTTVAVALLPFSTPVLATAADLETRHEFKIPAQPLDTALLAFSDLAEVQVLIWADARTFPRSPGVEGDLSAASALATILDNTGLSFQQVDRKTVAIVRTDRFAKAAPGSSTIHLAQSDTVQPATDGPSLAASSEDAPPPAEIENINVSASRIRITGYDQPTPVTVVGTAELERDARVDVGDVIRELPSFGGSPSQDNSKSSGLVTAGVQGLNLVSLRNLGTNRTLVLFDGQRVVSSSIQGGIDLSTMPASLVERIDVVTGGASAAWGSDAVAGVVNVIINKKFSGLQVNVEDSNDWQNAHAQRKGEISLGTDFADGRGHIILSGSITDSPDTFFGYQAKGYDSQRYVNNPAYAPGNGQPRLILADNVGLVTATPGGIITGGPLKGIDFTGPNAVPGVFNYGNVSQNYFTNGGTLNTAQSDFVLDAIPYRTSTGFAFGSFKLTDSVTASLQLNYGYFSGVNNSYSDVQYGTVTINADNPFIPAPVRNQMTALNLQSFPFGTQNLNNMVATRSASLQDEANTLGIPVIYFDRALYRGVFSLDGKIGENWTWNAYVQHGESRSSFDGVNNQQNSRYDLAVDAVTVTAQNVGKSGLPLGSIVCRSTLTNPTNGCAPLDVFGDGVASPQAIQYINGVARAGGDSMVGILKEDVASASASGTLPFGLRAGRVSTAFGVEYRQEEGVQEATEPAQDNTFQLGNFKDFYGKYNVKEAFIEFNAPLLKDQVVQNLSADVAGRATDYSTSGLVETYKVGLTSQVIDDLKVRASYSYDIRAPGLAELFNTGTPVTASAIDPHTGQGVTVFDVTEGNSKLKPEEATTTSAGFVVTPTWLPGFNLSLDYYDIDLKKAITSFSAATILARCAGGDQLFCSDLVFGGPNGALSEILIAPLNSDSLTETGLDFATDYRKHMFGGTIDVNVLANYTFSQVQTSLGVPYDFAGSLGEDSPYEGVPKFKGQWSATYAQGGWSGTVQMRVIGSALVNTAWGPLDIDNNHVPAVYYVDLRGSYSWDRGVELYAAIDNLADRAMPIITGSAASSNGYDRPFRDDLYDGFGRVWRLGVRAKF